MRVCYYLETHRSPGQVLRLVRRIRDLSPAAAVVVHHDSRGVPLDPAPFTALDARVLHSPGGYGDFSHVARYLDGLRQVEQAGESFDWVSNISGQDYPVTPLRAAEAELATTQAHAFMEVFPLDGAGSHWSPERVRSRYHYRYRTAGRPSDAYYRRTRPLAAVNRLQPWVRFSPAYARVGRRTSWPFPEHVRGFGGSFFTTLSLSALTSLRRFVHDHPAVVDWARHALAPEEMFLQTVLGSDPELRIEPDPRRYFDFSGSVGNHPRLLDAGDLAAMTSSGAWFARKFAEDAPVLDLLDDHLDDHPERGR